MPAGVAKDLDEQIGGAVHNLGLVGEVERGVDEAGQLHHPLELRQVTATGRFRLREKTQRTGLRGLGPCGDIHVRAELAEDEPVGALADLPRDEDEVAALDEGHVVGGGRGRVGQRQAKLGQAGVDIGHGNLRM